MNTAICAGVSSITSGISRRGLRRLGGALFQNFFEQHPLVRDMLIHNPQALGIDRQNKRIANLSQGMQRCQRRCNVIRRVAFVGNRRGTAVVGDKARLRFGSANQRQRGVAIN